MSVNGIGRLRPQNRPSGESHLSARDLAAVIAAFALFGAAWRWLM